MVSGRREVTVMLKDYGKVIAANLKAIAYENDRTQADICRDLHLSDSTVSSWFNGSRVPRMDKIDLLAHYFNCTRADIMEEHKKPRRAYYLDDATAQAAQELFDNSDLRALLDAARGNTADNLKLATEMLTRMKGTNPNG